MNNMIKNTCGKKRGCAVDIILPNDGSFKFVLSGVHGARNDISKILPLVNISLDEKLEKERQVEKMAA